VLERVEEGRSALPWMKNNLCRVRFKVEVGEMLGLILVLSENIVGTHRNRTYSSTGHIGSLGSGSIRGKDCLKSRIAALEACLNPDSLTGYFIQKHIGYCQPARWQTPS